jgi:hypothetical protein
MRIEFVVFFCNLLAYGAVFDNYLFYDPLSLSLPPQYFELLSLLLLKLALVIVELGV